MYPHVTDNIFLFDSQGTGCVRYSLQVKQQCEYVPFLPTLLSWPLGVMTTQQPYGTFQPWRSSGENFDL